MPEGESYEHLLLLLLQPRCPRQDKALVWIDELRVEAISQGRRTRNSQLEKMGIERWYARTNTGFETKVHASIFGLSLSNPKYRLR